MRERRAFTMDVKYINPFIEAVHTVFSTMIKTEVALGQPHIAGENTKYNISGMIGMSGDVVGSIVISFPTQVAKVVIGRFAGQEIAPESPDFADAIGELINMISGVAKAKFEGKNVSISTPSVVMSSGHTVAKTSNPVCIHLPCKIFCGDFGIYIAIREELKASRVAA